MRRVKGSIRRYVGLVAVAFAMSGVALAGQTSPVPPDKPEPLPASSNPAGGKPGSENPFPGEDSDVPILAPGGDSGADAGKGGSAAENSNRAPSRNADPDGDPVRTPDPPGRSTGDDGPAEEGFASSRTGLKQMPAEDDSERRPGESGKVKTRQQRIQEDVEVGKLYLDQKNWRGAHSRFSEAFSLDPEDPDAVWGLAESERHLALYPEAAEHYKLFLTYDPAGKRGREARKALEEVLSAPAAPSQPNAKPQQPAAPESISPNPFL